MSFDQPRKIDCETTFESIVSWVQNLSQKQHAPGLLVGISGTDSILTFLACAEAFKRLGKPNRVLALNFDHQSHDERVIGSHGRHQIVCAKSEFNWVAQNIFPWLQSIAPDAQYEIDSSIEKSDDGLRWGRLFSRAVQDVTPGAEMTNNHYFLVGTRNATEEYLGTYTQASKAVSMMPVINLFKSEVLEVCQALGVPQIAIDKSREIDCDCGRFDIQANYMHELDLLIMSKLGLLSKDWLSANMDSNILRDVEAFAREEKILNEFRGQTPYKPSESLVRAI